MKKGKLYTLALLSAFGLSGCAEFQAGGGANLNAPTEILSKDDINNIDLLEIVKAYACTAQNTDDKCKNNYENSQYNRKYIALGLFHRTYEKDDEAMEKGRIIRNKIYDILTTSADKNCKKLLVSLETYTTSKDIISGSVGALTGALGALTGGVGAKSALSAVSGVTHGIDATWDEAVLRNRTFDVIISGINISKRDHDAGNKKEVKALSLKEYSLERAIKDANAYSNACDPAVAMDTVKTYLATGGKTENSSDINTKEGMIKILEQFTNDQWKKFVGYDDKAHQSTYLSGLSTEEGQKKALVSYTDEILRSANNARLEQLKIMFKLMS